MKTVPPSGCARSHFHRLLYGCTAAMAIAAAPLKAEVAVFFNNTGLTNTDPAQPGTVTLAFTVDGSGNVTLDASTSSAVTRDINAVNAWDGPVGTISHPGAFNSSFTLTMTAFNPGTGTSKNLRLVDVIASGSTGGLVGVQGVNQFRIDDNNTEAIRFAAASVPAGSKLMVTSMDWRNSSGPANSPTQRAFSASPAINVTNVASTVTGTWDLSESGLLLGSAESFAFGTTTSGDTNKGYSLGALRFDIVNASAITAPTGFSASTDGAKVDLNWNDTLNAISYSVYRSESAGGPYGAAIASGLATSDYTDTTVSTGSTYYYVVTATDSTSEESGNSAELGITVLVPAPTGLTRTQGDGVINLDWNDSTSPVFSSFSVYRGTTAGGPYTTTVATGLTASEYADTSVTNGTTYYYVVRAVDNVVAAESANSAEVSGTPYAPVAGSTLFAHLDGSVAASVTADGDDIVSLWADQTANGFNASATGGVGTVYYPSLSQSESGLDGLDMGYTSGSPKSTLVWFTPAQQDQWLDFNSGAGALPYGGFAVFAVVHPDAILGGVNRDVVMSSTETNFALRYEGGRPQVRLGTSVLQGTAGAVTAGQTVVLAVHYDATTGLLQLWDSKSKTTSTSNVTAADFSSAANLFLGGSVNPDQYMKGMLGEAKIYRGVMSPGEFSSQKEDLFFKWIGLQPPTGLTASSGAGTVVLDWNDQFADFYTVYRGDAEGGPLDEVATNVLTSGFIDDTVIPGTTYYYAVSATKGIEESLPGDVLAVTPYNSIAGSFLIAHLDGSVAASVTVDENEVVSLWSDLTANEQDASSTGGTGTVYYPSISSSETGLKGVEFGFSDIVPPATNAKSSLLWFDEAGQDSWLNFNDVFGAKPYSGFAVFAVVHPNAILAGINRDVVMGSTENHFSIRYENGRPQVRLGTGSSPTVLQGTAGAAKVGETIVLAINYNAITGQLELWDSDSGLTTTATRAAGDFSAGQGLFLGGSNNSDQFMRGVIGEAKIFRGAMTPSEFSAERSGLVTKWIDAPGGFSSWQLVNGATGGFDEDHDGDGVPNGIEYFLGGPNGNTTGFTALPGVVNDNGTFSVTWPKGEDYAGTYGTDFWVETSATLEADSWTMETIPGGTITDDPGFVKYTFPAPLAGKRFVRFMVIDP